MTEANGAAFSSKSYLPESVIVRLIETRISDPDFALRAAKCRVRREVLAPTGRLNILAADHPARRVTKVGSAALAMADRHDYLARILRVLTNDLVDGVMGTMDILEDLLAIDSFIKTSGRSSLLDGKLLIASLNRGGLAGTAWELDDPITGPTPATCVEWNLDGTKILLRIADDDANSLKTVLASADAITEANTLGLPTFLEPLPVVRSGDSWMVVKTADALARIAGVASALGDSSRYLWLKLPYCDNYEVVARATTLPILLLGGESAGSPALFFRQLAGAMAAGPAVRGALVGRNVLYPGDDDPFAVAAAAGAIIHHGRPVDQALEALAANRGRELSILA